MTEPAPLPFVWHVGATRRDAVQCTFEDGSVRTLHVLDARREMLRTGLCAFPAATVDRFFDPFDDWPEDVAEAYAAYRRNVLDMPPSYSIEPAIVDTPGEAMATRKQALCFNGAQRAVWPIARRTEPIGESGEVMLLDALHIALPGWCRLDLYVDDVHLGTYYECVAATTIPLGLGLTLPGGAIIRAMLPTSCVAWHEVYASVVHEPVSAHFADAVQRRTCDSLYVSHVPFDITDKDLAVQLVICASSTATEVVVSGPHWRGAPRMPPAIANAFKIGDDMACMFGVPGPLRAHIVDIGAPAAANQAYWVVQRMLRVDVTIAPDPAV